jgi:hypothetical protein
VFESKGASHLLQCIAWRAGCQAVEATSETSRMESSSRPPRSRTSRRPEDAAAPSASPRLTSLCFGVAHCGARRQTAAVIASGPGKQLDSLEERETELSMSWVSSAVTCTAKFRMHQQVALPWALAIFWEAFLRGFRDPAQCGNRAALRQLTCAQQRGGARSGTTARARAGCDATSRDRMESWRWSPLYL